MSKRKASCFAVILLCSLLIAIAVPLLLHQIRGTNNQQTCVPSSCGKITSISHPFRLKDDPANCGDQRYELACENNITVLYLFSGKYYVQAIDYKNFTIRLVDPGISEADCSSIPRYLLSANNFSDYNFDFYDRGNHRDPYEATQTRYSVESYVFQNETILEGFYLESILFNPVIYLNCSNPVRDNPQYVDTTPCTNWHSMGYIYAIAGDLFPASLKAGCRVKLVAVSSSPSLFNQTPSYTEIHRMLSYGFDVSWMSGPCEYLCGQHTCSFNGSYQNLRCESDQVQCITRLGSTHCGDKSKLRKITEGYTYGILRGFQKLVGTYSEDGRSYAFVSIIKAGIVTGRYVVPGIIVRYTLGCIFFIMLLIYKCQRRHISIYENIEEFLRGNTLMPIRYSYKEIKNMTSGFKDKLGEGGFGSVYKGKLRSGPFVAIKILGKTKANGQEFISEVATLGRIHHANVVRLIGFCVEGSKRALIYEFMPNGSLDRYIFSKDNSIFLSDDKIFEVSLGVARGITYLHQGCDMQILHFDIKPHNILVDESFIPKVSDFGLAKLYPIDHSIATLTAARGTIGYMAPELFYKNVGAVSYKADVYSFGMLLMEMAGRRRNLNAHVEHSSQLYFPFWIYDQLAEGNKKEMDDVVHEERNELTKKMLITALWCIQLKPSDRPSMNKVVEMLEGDVENIEMPPKPSLYPNDIIQGDLEISASNNSCGTSSSDEEMTTNPLLKLSIS